MSDSRTLRLCPHCATQNTIRAARCYKCGRDMPAVQTEELKTTPETWAYHSRPYEMRNAARVSIGVLGAVLGLNGAVRDTVLIENASAGGLEFHSHNEYGFEERLLVSVPVGGREFVVEATVRRTERLAFSQWTWGVAVELDDPGQEFAYHLEKLRPADEPTPRPKREPLGTA